MSADLSRHGFGRAFLFCHPERSPSIPSRANELNRAGVFSYPSCFPKWNSQPKN